MLYLTTLRSKMRRFVTRQDDSRFDYTQHKEQPATWEK